MRQAKNRHFSRAVARYLVHHTCFCKRSLERYELGLKHTKAMKDFEVGLSCASNDPTFHLCRTQACLLGCIIMTYQLWTRCVCQAEQAYRSNGRVFAKVKSDPLIRNHFERRTPQSAPLRRIQNLKEKERGTNSVFLDDRNVFNTSVNTLEAIDNYERH